MCCKYTREGVGERSGRSYEMYPHLKLLHKVLSFAGQPEDGEEFKGGVVDLLEELPAVLQLTLAPTADPFRQVIVLAYLKD